MGITREPPKTGQSRNERTERGWGAGRTRLAAAVVAVVAFALCALGGAAISVAGGGPTAFDEVFYRAIAAHRSAWFDVPSLALNQLGGGTLSIIIIPAVVALVLLVTRGVWAALVVLVLHPLTQWPVDALKQLFERARPPHHEIAVNLWAYPSGHSAVAASLVVVTALLVRRRWLWIVGALYVTSMGFSRMYLSVHWFTDVLGGTALGIAVGLTLWAAVGAVRSLVLRRRGRNPVFRPSVG